MVMVLDLLPKPNKDDHLFLAVRKLIFIRSVRVFAAAFHVWAPVNTVMNFG